MVGRPRQGAIVVVGSYNRDIGIRLDRFPTPGETILAQGLATAHGGKGSNQAVQAARCGATVAMVAAVGTDAEGDAALALWSEETIDARAVRRIPGQPTGTAVILVEDGGENQIVVVPGANAALDEPAVAQAAAAGLFDGAALVVAQLETPVEAALAAFAVGRAAGARCLLNIAPASAGIPAALVAAADIVIANEGEAAIATGLPAEAGGARLCLALRDALRDGATAIVTVGADGAWLAGPEAPSGRHAPALSVQAVDATGAGDAFVGTFAAHLAAGGTMADALQAGVVAGSLACQSRGAVPSLPGHADIAAALIRRNKAASRNQEETTP